MTEELPKSGVDEYKFPDKYFEELREYVDEHQGMFSVVQGGLYRALEDDCRFNDREAMNVSRMLNNNEIEEAEDFVYDRLEEGVRKDNG